MFDTLLGKLPFLGRYLKYKKEKTLDDSIKELHLIKDSFNEAVSFEALYNSLKGILFNSHTELQVELIKNKTTKVSFHTMTSQSALELISKEVFGNESILAAEKLISVNPKERAFMFWDSNEESISLFYSFMRDMVYKASLTYGTIDGRDLENNQITEKEMEFINSILFRYLVLDLITLLVFYLEERNETTE